jgi:UDP-N-acetylmuramoyl-tripeptide--D-alanyl-D-alanine ligase
MRAALDDLKATAAASDGSRRVAVLGDMLELGPQEHDFHAQLGEQATEAGVDVLVTVGPLAASIARRFGGETHSAANANEAAKLVPELLEPGDVVLVKASRGVGLELVCRALGARDDDA